ncbi:MAG: DM13 domain-containing protein [Prochloraceae cyanobacterium]|nr:DM13 domain-containing protein [Prochloraceae cyanobacterium]
MKLNKLTAATIVGTLTTVALGTVFILPSTAKMEDKISRSEAKTELISLKSASRNVLREGNFVTVEQEKPTKGQARIVEEDGKRFVEFNHAFTTATGPQVRVLLHRNSQVPVKLNGGDYITLARIKSFKGAQRYAIPSNVNIDDFQSVVIWCKQFNVSFGYASLV